METHVKVVGVIHAVLGGLGVLAALTVMLVFGGVAGLIGASGDPDAVQALPIIGIAGTAIVMLCFLLSLPAVVVGIGLIQHKPWARIGGIVLSIFEMIIFFPIGTVLGIYSLWVLFSRDGERLFVNSPAAPPPVPPL